MYTRNLLFGVCVCACVCVIVFLLLGYYVSMTTRYDETTIVVGLVV